MPISDPVSLPNPVEYGIDPETGFLPAKPPLHRLSDPYFTPWETIMDDFNALLLAGRLRSRIHRLDTLEAKRLVSVSEQRRAFLVLSMLAHGYVWGKHEPVSQSLPACLSRPWCDVADMLGVRPVVCHAAVVLWNWKLLDPSAPRDLSNLATLATFSGSMDESWFYLITTAMEAKGGPVVQAIMAALKQTVSPLPDLDQLHDALSSLASLIWLLVDVLQRMYERCDPYVFFWRVRAHLAGWSNMAAAGLPHGLHYSSVDPPGRYRKYSGGSAGQSALMHLLDVALGVKHFKTGSPNEGKNAFLRGMRDYMPKCHAAFLAKLESVCNLREFCQAVDRKDIREAFDGAVDALKTFRDGHVRMVTLYIVLPARKGPATGGKESAVGALGSTVKPSDTSRSITPSPPSSSSSKTQTPLVIDDTEKEIEADEERAGLGGFYPQEALSAPPPASPSVSPKSSSIGGLARQVNTNEVVRGTGGTDLIPFLRQCRDETTSAKIDG